MWYKNSNCNKGNIYYKERNGLQKKGYFFCMKSRKYKNGIDIMIWVMYNRVST